MLLKWVRVVCLRVKLNLEKVLGLVYVVIILRLGGNDNIMVIVIIIVIVNYLI